MSEYNYAELWLMIVVIGIVTFLIRYLFLIFEPRFSDHPVIKRGMRAIPAAMLVALVVPFTLFDNQVIHPFRTEVYAICLTIPITFLTKKYGYGLIFALIIYVSLSHLGL